MFRYFVKISFFVVLLFFPVILSAVETAPRISDREIIEGLAKLDIKCAQLDGKIAVRRAEVSEMSKRLDQMRKIQPLFLIARFRCKNN